MAEADLHQLEKVIAWKAKMDREGLAGIVDACTRLLESRGAAPLTIEEQWLRRSCRDRFGLYDPSSIRQRWFIDALLEQLEETG